MYQVYTLLFPYICTYVENVMDSRAYIIGLYSRNSTVCTLAKLAHETSYIPGKMWGHTRHLVSPFEHAQLSKKENDSCLVIRIVLSQVIIHSHNLT